MSTHYRAAATGVLLLFLGGMLGLLQRLGDTPPARAPTVTATKAVAPNGLAEASSPYLRQHAQDPVRWYPWGEAAFARARRENKPVFLSVGYAACHWCHVMQRESFKDAEIARLLNRHFIAIKVDRERRPDIDDIYMLATEILTKTGGWPNSVFLTPDKQPFFAGGYFPRPAFAALLRDIHAKWTGKERAQMQATARKLSATINRLMNLRTSAAPVTRKSLKAAVQKIMGDFDVFNGGFGTAPKFPEEAVLRLLLRLAEKDDLQEAREAALLTLDHMLRGGLFDQLGGGFHRYATDNEWRLPHFEKMLYNQALITNLLLTAHRLTGAVRYARTARATLDFVLREMTAPEGAFYASLDAENLDTEGRKQEGLFYLWTAPQLAEVLGPQDGRLAARLFGVSEDSPLPGGSVLHLPAPDAGQASISPDKLAQIRARLHAARKLRPRPSRDEKIIAAWNGLMIETLARAAGPLARPAYLNAALRAARFTWQQMGGESGRLMRVFYKGRRDIPGQLIDFAALGNAYLTLYDVTGKPQWGERAARLAREITQRFKDPAHGDYFMTADDADRGGFLRAKQKADGALPASNAATLRLFARLAQRTGQPAYRQQARALHASLSGLALAAPRAHAGALYALDMLERGETGSIQYLGRGKVRVQLSGAGRERRLKLHIAPGWHINAQKPLEDFLIATKITLTGANAPHITVDAPTPITRRLGFNKNPLALYEGNLEFRITASAPLPKSSRLHLRAQSCSDKICLPPQTLTFVP